MSEIVKRKSKPKWKKQVTLRLPDGFYAYKKVPACIENKLQSTSNHPQPQQEFVSEPAENSDCKIPQIKVGKSVICSPANPNSFSSICQMISNTQESITNV